MTNKTHLSLRSASFIVLCLFSTKVFCETSLISGEVSLGVQNIQAKEYVLDVDNQNTLSCLDWESTHVPVVNVVLNIQPTQNIKVYAEGWTKLTSSTSRMDDYDWMDVSSSAPTHHSWHPNTKLQKAYQWKVGVDATLLQLTYWATALSFGYEETQLKWNAKGGHFRYPGESGSFNPNASIIRYQQKFQTPTLGLKNTWTYGAWDVMLLAKMSCRLKGKDRDTHVQRQMRFDDRVDHATLYALEAEIDYRVSTQTQVFLKGNWEKIAKTKGGTKVTDLETGESWQIDGKSAAMSARMVGIYLGVKYEF